MRFDAARRSISPDRMRHRYLRSEHPRWSCSRLSTAARWRARASNKCARWWTCGCERTEVMLARPEVEYVLVFENRGREVGATIDQPHGQINGYPFVPPALASEVCDPDGPCPYAMTSSLN